MYGEAEENLASVKFRRSDPRDIISLHSNSILAEDEPVFPLRNDLKEKILSVFMTIVAEVPKGKGAKPLSLHDQCVVVDSIPRSDITEALVKCGFDFAANEIFRVDAILLKYCGEKQVFNQAEFTELLEKFDAPSYVYGERLRKACARGEEELAKAFIIRGCNINTGDGEGQTSLHFACAHGKVNIISSLYEMCGSRLRLDAQDKLNCTPLWLACFMGNQTCVKELIRLKADVNSKNNLGKSCLHAAASRSYAVICQLLIDSGAVCTTDNMGLTPFHEVALKSTHASAVVEVLSTLITEEDDPRSAVDVLGHTFDEYIQIIGKKKLQTQPPGIA
jgi:hypothetical protein